MPQVSIICPILNEEQFIERCIDSVLEQDFPQDEWELLLVDGMSTDRTRQLIEPYTTKYNNIHLLDNSKHSAPCAMNIGIREAKGEFIVRIDAHAFFPANYVSSLIDYISHHDDISNVGCSCITLPPDNSQKSRAIASACSHPFGVGNSTFRIAKVSQPTQEDTVPFGCWRKQLFEQIGMFDEQLARNQDDEFNARTLQNGGKIILLPEPMVTYYSRNTLKNTFKMFYFYGLYKPLVNKKLKKPATIRQFIPPLFVTGLIIGLPLAIIFSLCRYLYIGIIILYLLTTIILALQRRNIYLPLVFFIIHLGYGLGYLIGLNTSYVRSLATPVSR